MKHEDFYNEYKQLQAKEIAELRRCLEAHGDEYDWDAPEHDEECRPIICVGLDYYTGDVDVKRVHIDIQGRIIVDAYEHDGWGDMQFDVDNVMFGHIGYIMSYMRERLTENEKLLISQAVCDLESGNHLLRERTVEQKKMISEVCIAIDTDECKRDDRQTLIVEQVKMCTDPDYKPQD